MKKYAVFVIIAVLWLASCGQTKTSNNSGNNQPNLGATPPVSNNANSILTNTNTPLPTNSEVTPEMLKQIEAQQRETLDKTKLAGNSNKPAASPQTASPKNRQNW